MQTKLKRRQLNTKFDQLLEVFTVQAEHNLLVETTQKSILFLY